MTDTEPGGPSTDTAPKHPEAALYPLTRMDGGEFVVGSCPECGALVNVGSGNLLRHAGWHSDQAEANQPW
jgi:hypothetical protein